MQPHSKPAHNQSLAGHLIHHFLKVLVCDSAGHLAEKQQEFMKGYEVLRCWLEVLKQATQVINAQGLTTVLVCKIL